MTTTATQPVMTAANLHKHYLMGSEDLHVLRGVSLTVERGKWIAVLGASGSGKSTLLHLLGGLDTPDEGDVHFNDQSILDLSAARRDHFRSRHVGFVFQQYHLLPELDVTENVLISAMVASTIPRWFTARAAQRKRAEALLEQIGLGHRLRHRPAELSGGERQRVAIARALINEPDVLLADEPTGNLDRATGETILKLLQGLRDEGQTIVMVSHDTHVADRADRVLHLDAGRLVDAPD